MGTSALVGLFLVSNPIGWGTAIVLAADSTTVGYAARKGFKWTYNTADKKPDFITKTGVDLYAGNCILFTHCSNG